jgi:hypothetical protein
VRRGRKGPRRRGHRARPAHHGRRLDAARVCLHYLHVVSLLFTCCLIIVDNINMFFTCY